LKTLILFGQKQQQFNVFSTEIFRQDTTFLKLLISQPIFLELETKPFLIAYGGVLLNLKAV
jgi:hypothetical protein